MIQRWRINAICLKAGVIIFALRKTRLRHSHFWWLIAMQKFISTLYLKMHVNNKTTRITLSRKVNYRCWWLNQIGSFKWPLLVPCNILSRPFERDTLDLMFASIGCVGDTVIIINHLKYRVYQKKYTLRKLTAN